MTAQTEFPVETNSATMIDTSPKLNRQQQSIPLLPKESENAERKRPLAIQELLEKKKARLAHFGTTSAMAIETNKHEKGIKGKMKKGIEEIKKRQQNIEGDDDGEGEDSEIVDIIGHLCRRDLHSETTSSGSVGSSMDYCAASISAVSFGHLLKRAMGVPNNHALFTETSKDEETSEDCDKQLEQRKNQLKRESNKLQMSPIKSISKVTASEVNESPLSKSVPHDRVFAQVPGRLSLLSNVVKYKMTVGEVKRRLMGPESFNFSLLGALLRRAKMPEKSQMLVDELSQVGLTIPRGRRRLTQVTLLSALTEAESVQFAKDFKKISETEFPAKQMALELLPIKDNDHSEGDSQYTIRLSKLSAALYLTTEFLEILKKDQSPVMENSATSSLPEEIQNPLSTFSMLTHGFGNPAIQVGIGCFINFLKHQIQMIEEQLQFGCAKR